MRPKQLTRVAPRARGRDATLLFLVIVVDYWRQIVALGQSSQQST